MYCQPRHLLLLPAALLGAAALALSSCSGGGGGGSSGPPFIFAELNSFPPGATPPGFSSSAVVVVADSNDNAITGAVVTMNSVQLAYSADNQDYEGNVVAAPGDVVTVNVTVGGTTYTASATQFTSYPAISLPAPSGTLDSHVANTVTWSGGAPTVDSVYVLGVLDAADPNGQLQWPSNFLERVQIGTTSFQIPAYNIPAGDRLMIVGIASSGTAVPSAAPGSTLVVAGFNHAPITVTGFPVTVRNLAAGNGVTGTGLQGVAWSGSQFVAVGFISTAFAGGSFTPPVGQILTSPDGISWTSQSSGASLLGAVASSGSGLVAVGQTATGGGRGSPPIFTSPDGITWTSRSSGVADGLLGGVAWSGTQFVAVGGNPFVSPSHSTILTSPDGVTWTQRASGTTNPVASVTWTGTQFVAVGSAGLILTSPDGLTWTQQTSNTSADLSGVTSGALIVAVGQAGPFSDVIVTSPDGVTWTTRSSTGTFPRAVAWSGTQFVAVGFLNASTSAIITSPDGITWTRQAASGNGLSGIVWSGTKFVMVGGGISSYTVLTSP